MATKLLQFRRHDKPGISRDVYDDELAVDPALVKIARAQRAAAQLRALEQLARDVPRLTAAVETLTAALRGRRRVA